MVSPTTKVWFTLAIVTCGIGISTPTIAKSPSHADVTTNDRDHWSLQPIAEPVPPHTSHRSVANNAIDAFVLHELENREILPSQPADRATLLRRASIDLVGLPPTPEEVAAFIADQAPDAWERVIDRLLASPKHGEKWARHWLDLAMFAESSGFEQDETRPNAWRYRDYVIDAFNADKPYDRFVTEQIAGDELWPDELSARIATAFMRHYPEEGNNKDILLARQEILHHVTDVVGSTFLGLTFNCAQCHDHKYDPISQRDYYRLQAFFANIGHDDEIPLADARELANYERRLSEYERRSEMLWNEMDQLLAKVRKYSPAQLLARYPDYVIEAMAATETSRTPLQSQIAYILNHKDCGTCPQRPKPHADPFFAKDAGALKGDAKQRYAELKAELDQLKSFKPADVARAMGIVDISAAAPPTHVLGVGAYTNPKELVEPGFLTILDPQPAAIQPPEGRLSTGRRSALARWLVDAKNPLTARVFVNRVWHYHFGRGIVGTPSDFGVVGDSPSHPELLDWLANQLVEGNWSVKRMHRKIVQSATYRQCSIDRPDQHSDPDNRLLWRFLPQRLDAELIRDAALSVSGMLNQQMGGPSVFPALPAGRPTPAGGWSTSSKQADHARRSVYIFVRRNDRFPMMETFDFPDTHESCACRGQTLTAPQALTLLNGAAPARWAEFFANRLIREAGQTAEQRVRLAFQLAYSRFPDDWELATTVEFLNSQTETIKQEHAIGRTSNLQDAKLVSTDNAAELQALCDFCLMLLNSNEFLFRF